MKITLSAAMRARDVSRPRSGQLAEAAAREEPQAAANTEPRTPARGAMPAADDAPQPRARRRRRRTR